MGTLDLWWNQSARNSDGFVHDTFGASLSLLAVLHVPTRDRINYRAELQQISMFDGTFMTERLSIKIRRSTGSNIEF